MHPADAIRAFAALAAEGHDEAAIANRYGYDPREVRKMLALASLSPKVVNALASDKIDVTTAQAFTPLRRSQAAGARLETGAQRP